MRGLKLFISCFVILFLFTGGSFRGFSADDDESDNKLELSSIDKKDGSGKVLSPDDEKEAYKSLALFVNVMLLIRQHYVDPEKVSYEKLIQGALKGMLQDLDPFSNYESPKRYSKTQEQTKGEFGGIGIVISVRDHVLEVIAPMEDTPGFKAGIHPGDIITEVDGKSTRNLDLHECSKLLKGPPGSEVTLTIYRKSEDLTKEFTVKRAIIKVSPVKGAKIIRDGIGYIRITHFSAPLADELDSALEELDEQNVRALIIDLRGNPGGLLNSAVEVCSRFLPKGELVVFTEGRKLKDRIEYRSLECKKHTNIPIVILVNGNSASAAEIVSACLQDHRRAILVGEKTFGKGSVQTIVPLNNKGAVRFTTAKYYTPSKKVIHGNGIDPDIDVYVSTQTERQLARQRSLFPGEVKPKTRNSVTDWRLKRALEILEGVCLFTENEKSQDDN
jgi:carboxyl-terminal processing protease